MPLEATHDLSADSDNAMRLTRAKQSEANQPKGVRLEAGDDVREPDYKIYVYNVLELEHEVSQPPAFPRFIIPARKRGDRFAVTPLPAFIKEQYNKPGSNDYYYKRVDGRKYAGQLLNPASYPGIDWKAQLQNWRSNDQFGNNLNCLGCFWSLTTPNDPALEEELQKFTAYATRTMNEMIRKAEMKYASGKQGEITPLEHFAMDFLRKQAPWHMQTDRMVDCPTCGEPVKEGIAYHRNSWGDKCPVDYAKCRELGIIPKLVSEQAPAMEPTPPVTSTQLAAEGAQENLTEEDLADAEAEKGAAQEKENLKKNRKR